MSSVRKQALIEAPLEAIWELVGNPARHSEWWPRVVTVQGDRFLEGDEYAQVTRARGGEVETRFMVEQRDDLHQIGLRCLQTGMYARWLLTEAQTGTFVDVEFGMDPTRVSDRVFDLVAGRIYFRRWLEESIVKLTQVATTEAAATDEAATGP